MSNVNLIKSLASNPLLAYSISIPEPSVLILSEYEKQAYPAILGNYTGISLSRVSPQYRMNRVLSFDVVPRSNPDPILIYSPIGDLKPYYSIWSNILTKGMGIFSGKKIKSYDESIKIFVESNMNYDRDVCLSVSELVFAVIEMLKFKNDVILNPNFNNRSF